MSDLFLTYDICDAVSKSKKRTHQPSQKGYISQAIFELMKLNILSLLYKDRNRTKVQVLYNSLGEIDLSKSNKHQLREDPAASYWINTANEYIKAPLIVTDRSLYRLSVIGRSRADRWISVDRPITAKYRYRYRSKLNRYKAPVKNFWVKKSSQKLPLYWQKMQ